ncbi:MAG: TRAP transporter small permease [Desulfobacula sp.]|nr:TRAP transporter small permease [Desulfobacula sp.]
MEISQKKPPDQVPVMDKIKVFHLLDRYSAKIETVLNIIGVIFIIFLMILTAGEIIGRYAFNHPIPGYVEDVELIMAAIVFLGFGYTQRVGAHIRMDMIVNRFTGRMYHLTEALSNFLGLFAYTIICIASFIGTIDAYHMGDVTEYLYTPTWPSKLCVPLGSFFLCIRFCIQIMKNLGQAYIGIEIRDLE